MKASNALWKGKLSADMPADLGGEIDQFETEIQLRKQGKIDEKLFAETRLRRGAYGQRYDNGQRHDGVQTRKLGFPSGDPNDGGLTKGPETVWDAPGMLRIKIPYGGMTPEQLEVMADTAEEYSDNIAHVTTRQDFQLHFIHIEDTPALMRRLAAVGITTREACGNSVRNVTACPIAGVCHDESFDVTPYAKALTYYLLGHPEAQDFGRKFKIAFSGCAHNGCGLVGLHDLGVIAKTRDGKRGFEFFVGGGLGSVPHQAKLFDEFLPVEELLPMSLAVCIVFGRLGEKKNRQRARVKFLIKKMGIDAFREEVLAERAKLKEDPRWTDFLDRLDETDEQPKQPAGEFPTPNGNAEFNAWLQNNVYRQRQSGYSTVTLRLPLGDITAPQLRVLADISRKYTMGTVRTTVEQNMVLRWVSDSDLANVHQELAAASLAEVGTGTITDVVSCPGTDTCKLGISASRGLGGELIRRFREKAPDDEVKNLRIKISGCFNSCGQHHVADLGFYGVSRKVGNNNVPFFQVVLGGEWANNAGSYGLPVGAIPSKRVPEAIEAITGRYKNEREEGEKFQDYIKRIGKAEVKKLVDGFNEVPAYDQDRSFYSDWGDPREYTLGDLGIGECAGEVVSRIDFELAAGERQVFEAQVKLDEGQHQAAGELALKAMMDGARALVRYRKPNVSDDNAEMVADFRALYFDTKLFFDKYAGARFAEYMFLAFENRDRQHTEETAHQLIEESGLFMEAVLACYSRVGAIPASELPVVPA